MAFVVGNRLGTTGDGRRVAVVPRHVDPLLLGRWGAGEINDFVDLGLGDGGLRGAQFQNVTEKRLVALEMHQEGLP